MSQLTFANASPDLIREDLLKNNAILDVIKDKMPPSEFMEAALQVISQPGVSVCTKESVLGAILKAAIFGFRISPELGQCWIVPRNVNVGTREHPQWAQVATFQIGYKGWQELAYRSGIVQAFDFGVVRQFDEFDFEQGTSPYLKFKPGKDDQKRGNRTHFFATATLTSGLVVFHVSPIEEIERIRKETPGQTTKNNPQGRPAGIWEKHYDAMALRLPIRKLCALKLPKSPELLNAISADGGATNLNKDGKVENVGMSVIEDIAEVEATEIVLHEDWVEQVEQAKTKEDLKHIFENGKAGLGDGTPELSALRDLIINKNNRLTKDEPK